MSCVTSMSVTCPQGEREQPSLLVPFPAGWSAVSVWSSCSNLGSCGVLWCPVCTEGRGAAKWALVTSQSFTTSSWLPPCRFLPPYNDITSCLQRHNYYFELSQWMLLKVHEGIPSFILSEEFHTTSNFVIQEKKRATSQYKRKHVSFEFSLVFSVRTYMYIWLCLHVFVEGKLAWVSQMQPLPSPAHVCAQGAVTSLGLSSS